MDFYNNKIRLAILLIFFLISLSEVQAKITFFSTPAINEIVIDGKWTTTSEWKDSIEIQEMRGKRLFGYGFVKDDNEYIYVLIDYIADETIDDEDFGRVRFDGSNDEALPPETGCFGGCYGDIPGTAPLSNDYIISMDWSGGVAIKTISQGNGTSWAMLQREPPGILAESSNDAKNDPYSNSPHMIYEFAIPRNLFGNVSEIGFSAHAVDRGERNLEWAYLTLPSTGSYFKPLIWATLSLSTQYEITKTTTTPTVTKTTTSPPPTTTSSPEPPNKTENTTTTNSEQNDGDYFVQFSRYSYTILGIVALTTIAIAMILFQKKRVK